MSQNQHEAPEAPQTNAEELGADAEFYEKQPPLQFAYDPSKLGTLTAEQMDRIYNEAWTDRESGKNPLEVQHAIYAKLERLGIDPSVSHDGGLVVRFVGIDGKSDIRPIVVDAGDFGTRIRNAEVNIAQKIDEGVAEVDPEEEHAQEQYLTTLLEDQFNQVRRLSDTREDNEHVFQRRRESLDMLVRGVKQMARSLMYGEPVSRHAIAQLAEQVAADALRTVNNEAESSEGERVQSQRYADDLQDVPREGKRKFSEPRAERLAGIMKKVQGAADDLVTNRRRYAGVTDQMRQQVLQLGNILSELQYSQYGHEAFGSQLNQIVLQLEQNMNDHRSLSRRAPELLSEMKRALQENQQ